MQCHSTKEIQIKNTEIKNTKHTNYKNERANESQTASLMTLT